MLLEHQGKKPKIHPTSRIAPNAVICGDVTIGENVSIGFGAVLSAESGPVSIGSNSVVMENAVLRGVKRAPLTVGSNVLIGPMAHLSGCEIADDVFIATGAVILNRAVVGSDSIVRIGAIVHVKAVLPPETIVPIYWVAAGDPAELYSPDARDDLEPALKGLNFPRTVFGAERGAGPNDYLADALAKYFRVLKTHDDDTHLDE